MVDGRWMIWKYNTISWYHAMFFFLYHYRCTSSWEQHAVGLKMAWRKPRWQSWGKFPFSRRRTSQVKHHFFFHFKWYLHNPGIFTYVNLDQPFIQPRRLTVCTQIVSGGIRDGIFSFHLLQFHQNKYEWNSTSGNLLGSPVGYFKGCAVLGIKDFHAMVNHVHHTASGYTFTKHLLALTRPPRLYTMGCNRLTKKKKLYAKMCNNSCINNKGLKIEVRGFDICFCNGQSFSFASNW